MSHTKHVLSTSPHLWLGLAFSSWCFFLRHMPLKLQDQGSSMLGEHSGGGPISRTTSAALPLAPLASRPVRQFPLASAASKVFVC